MKTKTHFAFRVDIWRRPGRQHRLATAIWKYRLRRSTFIREAMARARAADDAADKAACER
jgi:hypothetical protein